MFCFNYYCCNSIEKKKIIDAFSYANKFDVQHSEYSVFAFELAAILKNRKAKKILKKNENT